MPKLSELACYGRQKREGNPRTCLNGREVRRRRNTKHHGRRKRSGERLSTDQAAWSKRCRNRGSLARPYIDRLTNLSLCTWASTGPLLYEYVNPATTASLSLSQPCAERR